MDAVYNGLVLEHKMPDCQGGILHLTIQRREHSNNVMVSESTVFTIMVMIIFSLIVFFNVKVSIFFNFFNPLVSFFWVLVIGLFFVVFYYFYLYIFLSLLFLLGRLGLSLWL
jgi:hypothetical protein